jgi:hypothetical protein
LPDKKCTKCGEIKNESEYYYDNRRDQYQSFCKKCKTAITKPKRDARYISIRSDPVRWAEYLNGCARRYATHNPPKKKYTLSVDVLEQIESIPDTVISKIKPKESNRSFRYYEKVKNDPVYQARQREIRNRYEERNPGRQKKSHIRAGTNLRGRVNEIIRSSGRGKRCRELFSMSGSDFKKYMELQFKEGMSWDNYGTAWHVDHIIPCSVFDLSNPVNQKICFHYLNLRPLKAIDNMKKHNRVPDNATEIIRHIVAVLKEEAQHESRTEAKAYSAETGARA